MSATYLCIPLWPHVLALLGAICWIVGPSELYTIRKNLLTVERVDKLINFECNKPVYNCVSAGYAKITSSTQKVYINMFLFGPKKYLFGLSVIVSRQLCLGSLARIICLLLFLTLKPYFMLFRYFTCKWNLFNSGSLGSLGGPPMEGDHMANSNLKTWPRQRSMF